ncbi:ATP-binding protein [Bradyrhizobium sp. 160]|uniref:ATP-binding protein n=1 Tax=Bradyrhizobium sp. 160 TaxID=2782634 RepID=UPI003209339B
MQCQAGITLNSYPGALAQVISNLALNNASNAYPDKRGGRFVITVSQPDPTSVRLVCADEGVGILEPLQAHIFDPFVTSAGSVAAPAWGSTSRSIWLSHRSTGACASRARRVRD